MQERGFAADFVKLYELAQLAHAGTVTEIAWKDFCENYLINMPMHRCEPFFVQWARRHGLAWRWKTQLDSSEQLKKLIEFL